MKQWKAVTASAIGTSHQKLQLPNQDYGNYMIKDSILIGAVADGAGSAQYSDIGAKLAVEISLDYINSLEFESKLSIADEFRQLITRLQTELNKKAETINCTLGDLACTLMVVIATPEKLAALQVGDGFIVIRNHQEDYRLVFTPEKGEYINETIFITSEVAKEKLQIQVLETQPEFICLSTDGLEKVAIELKNCQPFAPFFTPLEQYLLETADLETDKYLEDFLNSERLNQRTQDDKTILLGLLESMEDTK